MASRRKTPRKRQQSNYDMIIRIVSLAALIFTVCLCAFNFDLATNGEKAAAVPLLDMCRSTCDERLQSAALESPVPSALSSSSAMDSLLLLRDMEQNSTLRKGRDLQRTEANPSVSHGFNPLKSSHARPRRLPTLIKILTGLSDEPYWNNVQGTHDEYSREKPIIARIEKPTFAPQGKKRGDRISSEDTVQMAAAAAAAAVWSKSIRSFGNNRMQRINSEWDAALRWIAGWDQQLSMDSSFALQNENWGNYDAERASENGSLNGEASQSVNNEGFNDFVDDLARLLQTCIEQCIENDGFQLDHENEEAGNGLSVGNFVMRSTFSWVLKAAFPRISFGKLDSMPLEARFILGGAIQLVISSIAVFALHSLWSWVSSPFFDWYSSLRYNETPEWLLEHERQIELAKSSQTRQKKPSSAKKGKKKQLNRQSSSKAKTTVSDIGFQTNHRVQSDPSVSPSVHRNQIEVIEPYSIEESFASCRQAEVEERISDHSNDYGIEEWQQTQSVNLEDHSVPACVETMEECSDSVDANDHFEFDNDVPSSESISSSTSSSPALEPIGSHMEEQSIPVTTALQAPSLDIIRTNSPFYRPNAARPQCLRQHSLPVPTQDQRDEAAKRLREYQQTQIQRLLYQKRLARNLADIRLSSVTSTNSGFISGSSYHSTCTSSTILASYKQNKALRPPPGFTHASEIQNGDQLQYTQRDDAEFLADNELILSKLLDDDDDNDEDEVEDMDILSTLLGGVESTSESCLDPSAMPLLSGRFSDQVLSPCPQSKTDEADSWPSMKRFMNTSVLKDNGGSTVKGVYGGNVW